MTIYLSHFGGPLAYIIADRVAELHEFASQQLHVCPGMAHSSDVPVFSEITVLE